jgi:hypothetical protein
MHLSLYSEQVLHGIFIVTCSTSLVSFYEGSMKQNKIYSIPSSSTSRHEPIHMPFSKSDCEAATSKLPDLNIWQYGRSGMPKTQKTK